MGKYYKILLVQPDYYTGENNVFNFEYYWPPLGLGYISEMLTNHGIEHRILDLSLERDNNSLFSQIEEYKPDIVGFSLTIFKYKNNCELIRKVKIKYPKVITLVGGPLINLWKEKFFDICDKIDLAIYGEGEYPVLDLCQKKPLNKIPGLIYRDKKNKKIVSNPNFFVQNLDLLPFPKYKAFDLTRYPFYNSKKSMTILTSRGCPYSCIYCFKSMGNIFRSRTPKNVFQEIKFWTNKGVKEIQVIDDNFTMDKNRVIKLCHLIIKSGINSKVKFTVGNLRGDHLDENLLTAMREAGFYNFAIGVETASNRLLKVIKKGTTIEKIESGIQRAIKIGFEVELFFILGLPTESYQEAMETIQFAQKYPVKRVYFFNCTPYPGTELYRWVEKCGYFLKPPEEYLQEISEHSVEPMFSGPGMNIQEKAHVLKLARAIQAKINKDDDYVHINNQEEGL